MKLPIKMQPLTNLLQPMMMFYGTHESTILTATSIGCSAAATTLALKNSRKILGTIDRAKEMLTTCQNKEQINEVYVSTLQELVPLLGPVVGLEVISMFSTIRLKVSTDAKIAGLTEALATANNAIAAYQLFKNEAEKVVTAEQLEQIQNEVAKTDIEQHPKTDENTANALVPAASVANGVYEYYDPHHARYFYSVLSPTTIRERIHNLSMKFTKHEINQYDDYGNCKITYNDIWTLIDESLRTDADNVYGWSDEHLRGDDIIEDAIDVEIYPAENMRDPNTMIWRIQMNGNPLFRTRY